MHCVKGESSARCVSWAVALAGLFLVGCKSTPLPSYPTSAPPASVQIPAPVKPAATPVPAPAPATTVPPSGPQTSVGSWQAYRLRAAQRITSLNRLESFAGPLPDPLASIPVLQIQLNRDGSVRAIDTLRTPKQFPQTLERAKAAVMRAAPFGPVGNLPQPWQFNETFLYNDDLKFQLRSLVEQP